MREGKQPPAAACHNDKGVCTFEVEVDERVYVVKEDFFERVGVHDQDRDEAE